MIDLDNEEAAAATFTSEGSNSNEHICLSDEEELAIGRRWDPLGEEKEENVTLAKDTLDDRELQGHDPRIKNLEDEQEILSNSLQALTSHFAQVQFRLRQIVEAPPDERDQLLESLEELANRGIPEVTKLDPIEHEQLTEILVRQQERQFEIIDQLKKQLSNVEKLAYDSGAPILPQSVLLEKQKVIIEELKKKLNLNVSDEEFPQLSIDEIRSQIDNAFGNLVQPLKMKETLVDQLKTQVVDLERFVAHLQCETPNTAGMTGGDRESPVEVPFSTYNSKTAKKSKAPASQLSQPSEPSASARHGINYPNDSYNNQNLTAKVSTLIDRATAVLNIFAETQLGCNSNPFQKNTLKKTAKYNHWGDLRAQLEVDVQEIISLLISIESPSVRNDPKANYSSDSDEDTPPPNNYGHKKHGASAISSIFPERSSLPAAYQSEITALVRKNFAATLQKLMQHGLRDQRSVSTSLVPFMGCLRPFQPPRNIDELENRVGPPMHVWELILEYYYLKNGNQFNDTPARKLSESFNLDITGMASQIKSNKHSMLSAIGTIIAMHAPYKRSHNSHFKAFVSAGLNSRKLTQWINLLFQSQELIENFYTEWSYVAHTGFRDALRTIDRLSSFQFDLPIDLAVRQFQDIKDVF